MEHSCCWGPDINQLVKKFLKFVHSKCSFATFTKSQHWIMSWVSWNQSTHTHTRKHKHTVRLRSLLIFPSSPCLNLPHDVYLSGFLTNFICISHLLHICYMSLVMVFLIDHLQF
jgi:hypothetical protein